MDSWDVTHQVCERLGIHKDSRHAELCQRMVLEEANVIERELSGRNKYSKSLEIALDHFLRWIADGPAEQSKACDPGALANFVASRRAPFVWVSFMLLEKACREQQAALGNSAQP